jgi:hypothetical protein
MCQNYQIFLIPHPVLLNCGNGVKDFVPAAIGNLLIAMAALWVAILHLYQGVMPSGINRHLPLITLFLKL